MRVKAHTIGSPTCSIRSSLNVKRYVRANQNKHLYEELTSSERPTNCFSSPKLRVLSFLGVCRPAAKGNGTSFQYQKAVPLSDILRSREYWNLLSCFYIMFARRNIVIKLYSSIGGTLKFCVMLRDVVMAKCRSRYFVPCFTHDTGDIAVEDTWFGNCCLLCTLRCLLPFKSPAPQILQCGLSSASIPHPPRLLVTHRHEGILEDCGRLLGKATLSRRGKDETVMLLFSPCRKPFCSP